MKKILFPIFILLSFITGANAQVDTMQTILTERIHIGDTTLFPVFADGPIKVVTTNNLSYGAILLKNPVSNLCTALDCYNNMNSRITIGIAGSENPNFYHNMGYIFMSDQNSLEPPRGLVIGHRYSNAPIIFAQNNEEVMRVSTEGNVGVGINIPSYKLDIAGLINTSEGIRFPDGTIQTTAPPSTYWQTDDSGTIYTWDKVGIGTSEPKAKVEIADGDIYISNINKGIIMKSPDGQCWRGTLDNSGSLNFVPVNCEDLSTSSFNIISPEIQTLSIYPNPTRNTITIASQHHDLNNMEAVLYNVDGKIIKKERLKSDYAILKLNDVSQGTYIIEVMDQTGKVIGSEKVIKN
ncbi:MAG: T9SS type A sorting domain-containing protein [Bacteroidales bacterium]|nr:T9SS type A sorting domain-containing protein [Bacteroidales bacterium]